MQWQDLVLTGGQFIFIIALLPSVFGKDKPALFTSLMTGTVLIIFALTFSTLSLWLAAISTAASGVVWLILAYQKYSIKL